MDMPTLPLSLGAKVMSEHIHEFACTCNIGLSESSCHVCGMPYREFIRNVAEANKITAEREVRELEELWMRKTN